MSNPYVVWMDVASRRRGSRKRRWSALARATAVVAILAVTENAMAGNILRRAGSGTGATVSPEAQAAAAAAASAATQAAAAQRSQNPLRKALDAIKRFQAAQDAARTAAAGQAGDVPNGLGLGGLQVDPGSDADASLWQGASRPTQTNQNGRTEVSITQDQQKAILSWKSFNVGKETDLRFDQSKGGDAANSWVVLNRVTDPNASPSKILGSIKADGQVYLINRNGIVFGGTSQVNVATLVASGLDFAGDTIAQRNGTFQSGLAQGATGTPVLVFGGGGGPVTVEAGAKISAANYGQVLLFGGQAGVVNGGSVEAPDGQVILAAGDAILLKRGSDNRGYDPPTLDAGGVVENVGILSAPRGNITMMGSEISQNGLATATTSGKANGSIRLGQFGAPVSSITFGPESVTQVLPDEGSQKVVGVIDLQGDARSQVQVFAEKIVLRDGATLYVPAGNVVLSANLSADQIAKRTQELDDPLNTAGATSIPDDTRIYIGSGARIDVSGLTDVDVAMEQNSVKAELRANELRDNPLLRNSPLRSRTVYFDPRLGVQIADLSGYTDLIERGVDQLMTRGGDLTLKANEVIAKQGSVLDLSGGSLRYRDGYTRSTQLIDPSGSRVRIEDAVAGVRYLGLDGDFVVNHARWGVSDTYSPALGRGRPHFERGYVQGSAAGTLTVSTNDSTIVDIRSDPRLAVSHQNPASTGAFRILDGEVVATTVAGPHQRAQPPSGATLLLDRAGDVTIDEVGPQLGTGFVFDSMVDDSRKYQHLVPARWFDGRTFTNVTITSGFQANFTTDDPGTMNTAPGSGHLNIGAGVLVDLGNGGSFAFTGQRADIDGTLRAPGGKVSITANQLPRNKTWTAIEEEALGGGVDERPTVRLGSTGAIDVAGRFGNDHLDGTGAPLAPLDGGKVMLKASNVILESGSLIDVGGGASLDASGAKLTAGKGGSITIDVGGTPDPTPAQRAPFDARLVLDGTLSGYALGAGGTLTVNTPYDIIIGDALPAEHAGPNTRLFGPEFFTQGGFSGYAILGERGVTVTSGTLLAPSAETLMLPDRIAEIPSATRLSDVATRRVASEDLRMPMALSLSTVPLRTVGQESNTQDSKDVIVEKGASIEMYDGSSVQLSAVGTVFVDGSVEARGGKIGLKGDGLLDERGGVTPLGPASVRLGPNARLIATGYQKSTPEGALTRRSVEAGGTITLSGNEVLIDPAAVVDVSGVQGIADVFSPPGLSSDRSRYEGLPTPGNAGAVSISAAAGVLAGTFRLEPGRLQDGTRGSGGSLVVVSENQGRGADLVVTQSAPAGFRVERANPAAQAATSLMVVADAVNASSADDVVLSTLGATSILFDRDVTLHTPRSLVLASPVIGTVPGTPASLVRLESGYVQLKGTLNVLTQPQAAVLDGDLTVVGDLIDVTGSVSLGCASGGSCGGFKTARFVSTGDIRLSDHDSGTAFATASPGLFSNGALEFDAAQVYVMSRLQDPSNHGDRQDGDPGFLVKSDVSIAVRGNEQSGSAPVPLSFGERLTLRAPVIEQGGVLRAPQGQIRLEAAGSVTLLPGSVTSASLDGLTVAFGSVQTGGAFLGYDQAGQTPTKSVRLDAPSVSVQQGAVIDVSGGGDLRGYSFAAGNGGSHDILDSSNGFAVLPSLRAGPAPVGGAPGLIDAKLKVGDAIKLQGVPGLEDGWYTLLPAHDALLPGGRFVQPVVGGGSFASAPATSLRPDGAVLASGYRGHQVEGGAYVRDPAYQRFVVMPEDTFSQYSQLSTYSFNESSRALADEAGIVARTPFDGGSLILSAQRLKLQGTGKFGAGPGGLLGNLDIAAGKIAVGAAPDASYLALDPTALTNFDAGSVLLGGTRAATASGTAVTVIASNVLVDIVGSAPWKGPEIILVATDSVSIKDGSAIRGVGDVSRDTNALQLSGDGALLRISTGDRVDVQRKNTTGAGGNVNVGRGVSLATEGSLSLDASKNIALAADAVLTGRQFGVSSDQVNLGAAPPGTPGTTLGVDALARLASSADLFIQGRREVDIYGDLSLGNRDASGAAALKKVVLDAPLLQGQASGTATITAGELTLRNSAGPAVAGSGGAGVLALDVDTLALGPGRVRVGYGALQGRAGAIEARGAGSLDVSGDLSLRTAQVGAVSGAGYDVHADGAANLTRDPTAGTQPAVTTLGGRVTIDAASVSLDTSVALPAGTFEATARGGAVQLGSTASIDVSGKTVDFQGQQRFAPGGSIKLSAVAGDVGIASGAVLDVSGTSRVDDAGAIEIAARAGSATVDGTLRAEHGGGSFALDSGRLAGGFSGLNDRLERSGGFDASRSFRLRGAAQDILLAAGETITAHEVVLRSDGGRVRVDGTIAAAGSGTRPEGGRVQVAGEGGVVVAGTIDTHAGQAKAGGIEPASGKVELVATGSDPRLSRIDVTPTAVIDVAGARNGGGSVVVRAPRDGVDVAVDRLAGDIRGAREVIIQGMHDYQASIVDTALVGSAALPGTMLGDATSWLGNSQAINNRLAATSPDPGLTNLLQVGAGMVVTSAGNLSIQTDVPLNGTVGPGYLGFVAAGNIDVRARVSDGFASADPAASLLPPSRSSSYSLDAGNEITLQPGAVIRTGTGDISIRAGQDLVLVDPGTVSDPVLASKAAAVIYTAGMRTVPVAGAPVGMLTGEFPIEGGDIDLRAGRDITAPLPSQTTSAWLFRYGSSSWGTDNTATVTQQTSWSIVYKNFEQGVGALGGGNVRVQAGQDISNLQVSIPTTGQLATTTGSVANGRQLNVRGGGDLQLSAGRDIRGGLFMLGRGRADLRAGGSVRASDATLTLRSSSAVGTALNSQRTVGALFALMDATATVTAGSSVEIEAAFDPMRQGQIGENLQNGTGSAWWGYQERTALEATSLGGEVRYANDPWASVDLTDPLNKTVNQAKASNNVTMSGNSGLNEMFSRAPPTLRFTSLASDVRLEDPFGATSTLIMAPAARGTLEVVAKGDVRIGLKALTMEDIAPTFGRGPLAAFSTESNNTPALGNNYPTGNLLKGSGAPLHAGDEAPVRIYAVDGSICAYLSGSCLPDRNVGSAATLTLPKPLDLFAGRDVMAGTYRVQNNGANDLSSIRAGRDIYDVSFQVDGDGAALLEAGRDVQQHIPPLTSDPTAPGGGLIQMRGDIKGGNLTLPSTKAAALHVIAGAAGVDYDGFAAVYLDPANKQKVAQTYLPELAEYMTGLGFSPALAGAELVAAFNALPRARRELFLLDRVYFPELKAAGIEYNDPQSRRFHSYDRGFRAVSLLAPADPSGAPAVRGDVILNGKQVETWTQGDITVFAPHGRVAVGSESVDTSSGGGMVTRRGGDIRIMADQSIELFTSRVFTLQGGDITMWTSNGGITAGSGAKTSVLNAPLTYTMTNDGVVTVNAFGLQTGAGIGVLDALQNGSARTAASRLDLIAPRGEVNAGDAGIRSVGDLNIAALVVVGIENIQVSGRSTGVPKVEAPSIGALTTASQLSQAATKEGVGPDPQAAQKTATQLPSIITVEVVGYEETDSGAGPNSGPVTPGKKRGSNSGE